MECQQRFRSVQFFYVSICVAYICVIKHLYCSIVDIETYDFHARLFLRNDSFFTMLPYTAKDYREFRTFSRALINISLNNVKI